MSALSMFRARLAEADRHRDEDGYILVAATIIISLLMTVLLILSTTATNATNVARGSRNANMASLAETSALSQAMTGFNQASQNPYPSSNGVATPSSTNGLTQTGAWSTSNTTHLLTVSGASGKASFTDKYPLRARYVTGQQAVAASGAITYGVAANGLTQSADPTERGAWGSPVSTGGGASTYNGTVAGANGIYNNQAAWDFYGPTKLTLPSGLSGVTMDSYSNGATNDAGITMNRSNLTAGFDVKQVASVSAYATSTNCPASTIAAMSNTSAAGFYCSVATGTLGADTSAINSGASQVLFVKGDLTISGDINPGTTGQLHIYVDGNVIFRDLSTTSAVTRNLANVFIYSPTGSCQEQANLTINLSGALACQQINLPNAGNKITWVKPNDEGAFPVAWGVPTATMLWFTEQPGFLDEATN